jgi:hypothetical protein
VSLKRFQTLLTRLIAEPDFRDAVRADAATAFRDDDLTALEASRLARIAVDRGLDVNRTLHKGFRLGKLRAMLPLTCQLLGNRRLVREVAIFWQVRPPSSFYFIPEAIEFCDFVAARRLRLEYLAGVLAYERATLELERARVDEPAPQRVRFEHAPSAVFAALMNGRVPRGIPRQPSVVEGWRGADGRAQWRVLV